MKTLGIPKEIYLKTVLEQVPRLIGLLDRDPSSSTYGCFDREYWHYKTTDFPCARKQEAVLTLALLHTLNHPSNPYYQKPFVLEWVKAGITFWTKIQEKNGTFNEWYPHENSFVATAFTSAAISETLLIIKEKNSFQTTTLAHLEKAAKWLSSQKEIRAQNQVTGAALALYNTFLLTKNQRYDAACWEKIGFLQQAQSEEGWFEEYGGADIGYLSLAVDYLTKLYTKSKKEELLTVVENACTFLQYFLHPNRTSGGIYGSRRTQYLIPSGFEILSDKSKAAKKIAFHNRSAILNNTAVNPKNLDDRYWSYIGYTWLQAYTLTPIDDLVAELPWKDAYKKEFPKAGLLVHSAREYLCIINTKTNTLAFYSKDGKKSLEDAGILLKLKDETILSASIAKLATHKKNSLTIKGNFSQIKKELLSPTKNVLLRSFQITAGKNERLGKKVKDVLRNKLITDKNESDYTFKRELDFKEDKLSITDSWHPTKNIKELLITSNPPHIVVPSACYFDTTAINTQLETHKPKEARIKRVVTA